MRRSASVIAALVLVAAGASAQTETLHVDMHAHPSRFHRAAVSAIAPDEVARYIEGGMHVAVCNISTDTPFRGGYTERDGTVIPSGQRRAAPGEVWAYTLDRMDRLDETVARDDATFVRNPAEARAAAAAGILGLIPALEGADALEDDLERLHELHDRGLGLIQLVHFRANTLGHIQTWPYSPGGLTEFGRRVVRGANALGIVIDLAHANSDTIRDTLDVSRHPVIFSHTGARALQEGDRYLGDDDIEAIAAADGVIGIWPNGSGLESVADMARHIAHIRDLVGIEHVGIGSDLRGMGAYSRGFGEEANFLAIEGALAEHGFDRRAIDLVMGGNFMRVWEAVTR